MHGYVLALSDEEYDQHKMWLKHSSEPWPKVLDLWALTAAKRRVEIQKNTDNGIAQIFKEWPRYKDATGYTLVRSPFCLAAIQFLL